MILKSILFYKIFTIEMASAIKNSINFRIRYITDWGRALYIVIECDETLGYPFRLECIQMQDHVWETGPIQFLQNFEDQKITYYYFVADFDDYQNNKIPVKWQGSDELMIRHFERKLYKDKHIVKFDQCNQRIPSAREQGQYQIKQCLEEKNMIRTIQLNLTLIKGLPEGRWIYAMPLPDSFDQSYQQKDFLKAERMQRFVTKNPSKSIWKLKWIYTIQQIQLLGGSHNIAFFESFYYKRLVQQWHAILPNGSRKTIQEVTKMLQQSNTPYEIQLVDEDGEKVLSKSKGLEELIKRKFIYETTKQIESEKVFEVFVISQSFGRQKMSRIKQRPLLWEVQILIAAQDIQTLEYYFQVNLINQVSNTNTIQVSKIWSLKNPKNAINNTKYNYYVHQQGNIANRKSYSRTSSYSHQNVRSIFSHGSSYSNSSPSQSQRGSRSTSFYDGYLIRNSRSGKSRYYGSIYKNLEGNQYSSTRSSYSSSSSSLTYNQIPVQKNMYLHSYCYGDNITNHQQTMREVNPSHIYIDWSSQHISNRSIYTQKSDHVSRNKPSWHTYYGTTNYENLSSNSTQSTSSQSIVTHNFNNHINNPEIITKQNIHFKNNLTNLLNFTNNKHISTSYENIRNLANDFADLPKNILNYQNDLQNLWNKQKQIIRYVKVKDYLNPIKLKLIKKSKVQEISDNFQKQIKNLKQQYPSITNIFQEIKQIRQNQNKSFNVIFENNLKVFFIQLITASKKWGKDKYNIQGEKNIMKIISKYPTLKTEKQMIYSILFHLNEQIVKNRKYYQTATHSGCQQGFRTQLDQKFKQLRQKSQVILFQKEKVIELPLYKHLIQCIVSPFEPFKTFGLTKGIMLNYDNLSQKLMRILIQYSVIYSIGRQYFDNTIFTPFGQGCSEFDPFCQQNGNNSFLLSVLQRIRNQYISQNGRQSTKIEKNKTELKQLQEKVVNKIESTVGKQALDIINISYDIDEIKKQFDLKGKNSIIIKAVIDLEESEAQFMKELQQIDNMLDQPDRRFVRISSLKNHKFVKSIKEFK